MLYQLNGETVSPREARRYLEQAAALQGADAQDEALAAWEQADYDEDAHEIVAAFTSDRLSFID